MSDNKTQHLFMEADRGITVEKDGQRRCMGCMELYSSEYELCPHCGYSLYSEVENALHMYPGTVLNEKYVVGKVLGYGGFGVTYLAWDTILNIKVAIKEYLPSEFSTRSAGQSRVTVFSGEKSQQFSDGKDKFVDEAKRLAMFRNEQGIVKIYDSFEENGTAYIAMEYLEGETLAQYLERENTVPVDKAVQMLMPVIESLNKVHDEGIIHRDIAPDNIFLTEKGEVKLIDFGASRYATTSRSRSLTVIIKPGYSAEEQYRSRGDQGAHTDVYSIGAVLYRMITGETPPDAMERRAQYEKNRKDILIPISKFTSEISKNQENSILNAMNVRIEDRTPDMISFAGELLSGELVKRRKSGLRKIDPLTWPLWAKIGVPLGIAAVIVLCILLAVGVIGPKSTLKTDFNVPDGQTLVPDIVADELEDAQKTLEDNQLKLRISDRVENAIIKKDMVLLQNPDAFNIIEIGSFIDITISDGFGTAFVPDVANMSLEEATALLESEGFKVITKEEESDIVSPGSVISQSVAANTELEKGSEITLVISTGSDAIDTSKMVVIPNLTGMTYEQAVSELKKYGLYIQKGSYEYNEALPANQIIGQYPSSGIEVYSGDTVTVTINMGAKTVNVPSVEYKKLESARQELEAQELKVTVKYEESENIAEGTVIRQSPSGGASVKANSTVTIVVSSGYSVTVPNVKNMALEDAREVLNNAGLTSMVSEYKTSSSVAKGKVISQSVPANSKVEQGTRISLVVSSGTPEAENDNNEQVDKEVALTSLKITSSPSKTNYFVGDSFNSSGLKVVAAYSDGTEKDVTDKCSMSGFDSSNSGSGTVKVSYTENGVTKSASFTVQYKKPTVTVNPTSIVVVKGGTAKLSATVTPSSATVNWSSNNANIATVSSDGTVRGVAVGSTNIIAKITYGGKSYTYTVPVNVDSNATPVTSVTLNKESVTMNSGDTLSLTATIEPSNATNKNITWSSSNSSVATVSSSGVVTAKSAGTANITVKTADGAKTDVCKITVKENTVTSMTLSSYSETITLLVGSVSISPSSVSLYSGDTQTLSANVNYATTHGYGFEVNLSPSGLSDYSVSISSSNPNVAIASVVLHKDTEKQVVSVAAKSAGTATITVKSNSNPNIKKEYTVTVKEDNGSWSSGNTSVATVSSSGTVTAKNPGTTSVKYTCAGQTASCNVSVKEAYLSLSTSSATVTIKPNNIDVGYLDMPTISNACYVPYGMDWNDCSNLSPLISANIDYPKTTYQISCSSYPSNANISFSVNGSNAVSVSSSGLITINSDNPGTYTANINISMTYGGMVCDSAVFKLTYIIDDCNFSYTITNNVISAYSSQKLYNEILFTPRGKTVGSGNVIFSTSNGLSETVPFTCFMFGDCTKDGVVNGQDALLLKFYREEDTSYIAEEDRFKMDLNMDGQIDQEDQNLLLYYREGRISSLPTETGGSSYFRKWFTVKG